METSRLNAFIFTTGMFRSGTTLFARLLNAHPEIAFASDPFASIFKSFRNAVAEKYLIQIDEAAPLNDYYFSPQKQEMMKYIQNETLYLHFNKRKLSELKKLILQTSHPYSPRIGPFVETLEGDSYADLITKGIDILFKAYGTKKTNLVGFKEVWTDEFALHILKQFPESKVIHVIRDPRAVCASKNVTNEKYPWLFLIRQWRKLATFSWVNAANKSLQDRVFLLKFEDLLENPLKVTKEICSFINVDFHYNLIDPTTFMDGNGCKWKQNSSHFEGKQVFNQGSINKWQKTLKPETIRLIEYLCMPEMLMFDYKPESSYNDDDFIEMVFNSQEINTENLANWIKPYSCLDPGKWIYEMSLEYTRRKILMNNILCSNQVKCSLCLNASFFDAIVQKISTNNL